MFPAHVSIHCVQTNPPARPPTHPPAPPFTRPLVSLAFDQCLCRPPPRGVISGGARDRRESLVHAPMLFINGAKTGVGLGALCVWQQWPVTAATDMWALGGSGQWKRGGSTETEGRTITVLTVVAEDLVPRTWDLFLLLFP